ncbi:MAG: urease accessory protein UreD [Elusimicrobiota bacterium]
MPALSVSAEKTVSSTELAFEAVGGRTAVVRCRAATPLKILAPRHAGTAAWACASSHGGGLLSGDSVAVTIDVRAGARQTLAAAVAADGLLVVAPDPVVCYAGARYAQRQEFDLAPSASLVIVDWLTWGRAPRGERWRFESYESRLAVRRGGKALLRDATLLDHEAGPLAERLGRFDVVALALATGPLMSAGARALLEEIARRPAPRRAPLVVSAAPVGSDGALLRVAAESFEDAARELRRALAFAWAALGDDPWSSRA